MSNSPVERYEQLLAQDPSSIVFVELAKALLDKGDAARALEICEQGVMHHSSSVVGRVLWGKALIQLGRPAEAMEQFDRAVVVDRDNPHAYNLIGEVLLQKGLYRSALPLLRKAAALQPNDARIQKWLQETQRALSGGPPPDITGATLLQDAVERGPAPATLQARAAGAQPAPGSAPPAVAAQVASSSVEGGAAEDLPPAAPEPGALAPGPAPGDPGLLGDLPPPDPTAPPAAPDAPVVNAPPVDGGALLADIPLVREKPAAVLQLPRVEVSEKAAAAIAQEYERELREKLEEQAQDKTFVQRHWGKLAVAAVLGLAVASAATVFFVTRAKNHGKDLKDSLALARKSFGLDTAAGYHQGLDSLAQAVSMDSSSEEAWALTAYGRALLYAEHGGTSQDRAEAQHALEQSGVAERFPALALVARYYAADPLERDAARRAVLESTLEEPEVEELAGRLLLQKKDSTHAVARFTRALELSANNNVRALVTLGNYYKDSGDFQKALEFYRTAAQLSPLHSELVVGAAECRLALWQDFAAGLEELEKLPEKDELSPELQFRKEIAHARLVAANGNPAAGIQALNAMEPAAAKAGGAKALEVELGLGEVYRMGGDMASAQKAYETALKQDPKNVTAREGLGRVLLARDRERELLGRVTAEDGARKVLVVRAAAYAKLGDFKHVRAELEKTQVKGKFPVDSVVYLALADAAESKGEVAQTALEKTRASLKRPRSELSVALGTVYWERGLLDKAQAQFEDAMKDPLDYEGACSLGRLLLRADATDRALEALKKAVARNGSHGEARDALVRVLLRLGRTDEALKETEAWQLDNPGGSALQLKDYALALQKAGRWKEAETAVARAMRLDGRDAEAHRIRAQLLFGRGDGRGAFGELERANHLDPKDAETFCEIGRAYLRQGDGAKAAQAFGVAGGQEHAPACARVGVAAARLPMTTKAVLKELAGLAESAPAAWDRAWASAVLARARLAAGEAKEARRAADLGQKLDPFMGEAWYAQGLVALHFKDFAKAREAFEKAVGLEPTFAAYHLAFADLLSRADQDPGQAMTEYELFLKLSSKSPEQARVKRLLPALKKHLARR